MANLLKKFVGGIPWVFLLIYFVLIMAWSYFVQHQGLAWLESVVSTIVFGIVVVFIEFVERRWKARRAKS